ncbi:MAG TPA: ISAs1 family transposase, partial [Cyanobacteria bacterium UBA11049]|nr:ISAs1 family transposase [Cyanobacteria bacterium UBA11049]
HWGIENRLHWVKDVIFGEDAAPFSNYSAATNWSIILDQLFLLLE